MTERKFTDEEIIKALKHCLKSSCLGCPRASNGWLALKCADGLYNDVVALINRQKAEIDGLKKGILVELDYFASEYDYNIRAEALNEYVTELEKRLIEGGLGIAFVRTQMHKLLKEMTDKHGGRI